MAIRTERRAQMPLSRVHFQLCSFQTHLDAMLTLAALVRFNVGLSKSFHQVNLADML